MILSGTVAEAFVNQPRFSRVLGASTRLAATKKKANNAKSAAPKKTSGFGGVGGKAATPPPARPIELLRRSERKFEEMEAWYATESERAASAANVADDEDVDMDYRMQYFIVSARLKGGAAERGAAAGASRAVADWVPALQLAVLGDRDLTVTKEFLAEAVGALARECYCALTTSVPSLKSLPATNLEYAAEKQDSFEKHVYPLWDPSFRSGEGKEPRMNKKAALAVLFPDDDAAAAAPDADQIKRQYRRMSMQHHPDRNVGVEQTDAEVEAAAEAFRLVQAAYSVLGAETHSPGMSWYEALGGTERQDFHGLSVGASGVKIGTESEGAVKGHAVKGGWSQAVYSLDPELPQFFASRNTAALAATA